jgi:hypothetical protein
MSTQALPYAHLGDALATDYFQVREQFSDEQWEHFIATRRFVDSEVLPSINEYWEAAELPWPLMRRLAAWSTWSCVLARMDGRIESWPLRTTRRSSTRTGPRTCSTSSRRQCRARRLRELLPSTPLDTAASVGRTDQRAAAFA